MIKKKLSIVYFNGNNGIDCWYVAVMSISGLDTSNKDESNKVKTILVPNVLKV